MRYDPLSKTIRIYQKGAFDVIKQNEEAQVLPATTQFNLTEDAQAG